MIKKILSVYLPLLLLIACHSGSCIKEGMGSQEVEALLGKADSLVVMPSVEDVYTNKLIKMEALHYGDTILIFANDQLVKGL